MSSCKQKDWDGAPEASSIERNFPSWRGQESFSVVKINYIISSWIYSFLSGYLDKPIHTKLGKNLCLNIKYKIQLIDALLRKHKGIDTFAQVDYSLVGSPAVSKSHINLDLKGIVYPVGNHTDPPFVPFDSTFNLSTSLLRRFISESNAGRCVLQITDCVKVFAVLPNSTTQYIFAGNLTAITRANLTISKQELIISLLLKRFQFSLLHSSLGFPYVT
ncbi:unnamed protein product [Coccothraustes coccothraustes]